MCEWKAEAAKASGSSGVGRAGLLVPGWNLEPRAQAEPAQRRARENNALCRARVAECATPSLSREFLFSTLA